MSVATRPFFLTVVLLLRLLREEVSAFAFASRQSTCPRHYGGGHSHHHHRGRIDTPQLLIMALPVNQQEAQRGIDKVVAALRKDKTANTELGRLEKVTTVLGFGSPAPGTLAVRFNAAFKKGGAGLSSVPLPFGLGQSNVSEGRGTMVGQVKASISMETGKLTSCSVFRDLGYGRSFELKV